MTDPTVIGGEVGAIIASVIAALYGVDRLVQHKKSKNGSSPMTRELCDERTKNIRSGIKSLEEKFDKFDAKLEKLGDKIDQL